MSLIKVLSAFFVYLFMCSIFSSRGDDRFSAQNHVIAALRNFASTKNVHVTLVIHPRKVRVCVCSFKLEFFFYPGASVDFPLRLFTVPYFS